MFLNNRITITIFFTLLVTSAFCQQSGFSIATNADIQHNFKKGQRYWTIGQTTHALFHLSPKDGVDVLFAYYARGIFKPPVTATAKLSSANPQEIHYTNTARMRLKQFSIGWRKYLKGTPDAEKGWNLYTNAGFGLLLGTIDNIHSVNIDTTSYAVPVRSGKGNFKR